MTDKSEEFKHLENAFMCSEQRVELLEKALKAGLKGFTTKDLMDEIISRHKSVLLIVKLSETPDTVKYQTVCNGHREELYGMARRMIVRIEENWRIHDAQTLQDSDDA